MSTIDAQPDKIRELIFERLHEKGISLNAASKAIGRNSTYLFHFLNKFTPRYLSDADRVALEDVLGLSRGALEEASTPSNVSLLHPRPSRPFAIRGVTPTPTSISVLPSRTSGGRMTGPAYTAPSPDTLTGNGGQFAFVVPDRRLEPAARRGSLVYTDPRNIGAVGDMVVVTTDTDEHIIGILSDVDDDGGVTVAHLTPPGSEHIPVERVAGIAKVVLTQHP